MPIYTFALKVITMTNFVYKNDFTVCDKSMHVSCIQTFRRKMENLTYIFNIL